MPILKISYSMKDLIEKNFVLEIGFSDLSNQQVLEYTDKLLTKNGKNHYFVTPNPELLVIANNDASYRKVLNSADLALTDGIGVVWASRLIGKPIIHRITGTDLIKIICGHVNEKPITVGFLGGRPGVAEEVSKCLLLKFPKLKVTLTYEGKPDQETLNNIKKKINGKIDILFVAFGSPRQEKWIYQNLENLPAKLTIGVGGAFDFISGKVRRAPKWMRRLGFEWLFRLIIQPWRIKRQLSLIIFIFLVLKQRLLGRKTSSIIKAA